MSSPGTVAAVAGHSTKPPVLVTCLLFSTLFIAGQAEGFSLAAAKDASRFVTTSTAVPSRFEEYQPDFRGIKAAMHASNSEGQASLSKHQHHHSHHDTMGQTSSPDFERQLEQLKERPEAGGEQATPAPPPPPQLPPGQPPKASEQDETPVAPISRKDELFTPGLGVEEVSFLGPIRKPEDEGGTAAPEAPGPALRQPDLLESEADVLEELRKLSGLHDAVSDPLLAPSSGATPGPAMRVEKARVVGIGGGTGDTLVAEIREDGEDDEDDADEDDDEEGSDEDDMEDELDGEEEGRREVTTVDPEKEVISLEERLSASLKELAELRRRQSYVQHSSVQAGPSSSGPPAYSEDRGAAEGPPETKRGGESPPGGHRAAMRKAHMARKLMDPEDPKKDEDLLELMLRIAENPDEWKRVHNLLRQLDDDLTTYEKTMHRVHALATERSAAAVSEERQMAVGASSPNEKDARREEMTRSGLPAGSHGEAVTPQLASTTQHPPPSVTAHHKDWPKFAYHRVTTAPHPDHPFIQQQQQHHDSSSSLPSLSYSSSPLNPSSHHHRNAYIAVSVITPPGSRGGKQGAVGRPLPSPPPVYAAPPTQARHREEHSMTIMTTQPPARQPGSSGVVQLVDEETLGAPSIADEEEEQVDQLARQESSLHHQIHHSDPVEEQLRALAAVEEKLRHHLHEKERMRHLLMDGAEQEGTKLHRNSKRSVSEMGENHHIHHRLEGDRIALRTS